MVGTSCVVLPALRVPLLHHVLHVGLMRWGLTQVEPRHSLIDSLNQLQHNREL